ncbi:hypothetical protein FJ365_00745 [Candidatus Dependentiae bacterium]|nr:hypothetical protein [Candidatus Dependentiae bacterium]
MLIRPLLFVLNASLIFTSCFSAAIAERPDLTVEAVASSPAFNALAPNLQQEVMNYIQANPASSITKALLDPTKEGALYQAISTACFQGRLGLVALLLQSTSSIDINFLNRNVVADNRLKLRHPMPPLAGERLITRACWSGNLNLIQFLVEKGARIDADCNQRQSPRHSPLHVACITGNYKLANYLIQTAGTNRDFINLKNSQQQTPLHLAVQNDDSEKAFCVVQLLCENGADINTLDRDGRRALHYTAIKNHAAIATYLLKKDGNPLGGSSGQPTALHIACKYGALETATAIISHAKTQDPATFSALINAIAADGYSALHMLCLNPENDQSRQQHIARLLRNEGANMLLANTAGDTPSALASKNGLVELATDLLVLPDAGRPDAALDAPQQELLHFACLTGNYELANILIEMARNEFALHALSSEDLKMKLSAFINLKNSQQQTPLHLAVQNDDSEKAFLFVKLLCENGADINALDGAKHNALHYTAVKNHAVIAAYLLENSGNTSGDPSDNTTALHIACKYGALETATAIISHTKTQGPEKFSALINATTADGYSALHMLCLNPENDQSRQQNIARLLRDEGANMLLLDAEGHTPSALASKNKLVALVTDLDVQTVPQEELLHFACLTGNYELANASIEMARTKFALDALSGEDLKMKLSAFINLKNSQQHTPLHIAIQNDDPEKAFCVVQLLCENGADINALDGDERRPLHYTAIKNHAAIAAYLLKKGGNPLGGSSWKPTALHIACEYGALETATVIISHTKTQGRATFSALINAITQKHFTALHMLCLHPKNDQSRQQDIAKLLMDEGADMLISNSTANTASALASKNGLVDLAETIFTLPNVYLACQKGSLKCNASSDTECYDHECTRRNRNRIARWHTKRPEDMLKYLYTTPSDPVDWPPVDPETDLLKSSCDGSVPDPIHGLAPFHFAVANGTLEFLTFLLDLLIDPSFIAVPAALTGRTSLHIACLHTNEEVLRTLCEWSKEHNTPEIHKIFLETKDKEGKTALNLLNTLRKEAITDRLRGILLEAGASPGILG